MRGGLPRHNDVLGSLETMPTHQQVMPSGRCFSAVKGTFYRAVDPLYVDTALRGSRQPGRYSSPEAPALYLSSSPEGLEAAMIAHRSSRATTLQVVEVDVDSDRVLDLRDEEACSAAGVALADAVAPWQDAVAAGAEPRPWTVRRRLDELGAYGLIDPSRQSPGLWHLALFRWNSEGIAGARVRRRPDEVTN